MADAPPIPPGHVEGPGGIIYMMGPKGELIRPENVKPKARLEDDTARQLIAGADALAAQIAAFKRWAFETVDTFVALQLEKFGAKAAGAKGNMTLYAFDGSLKVVVQTADRLQFGPEIQVAKEIILHELVPEWAVDSNANLVALVQNAFNTDRQGQLNRYSILSLRRLEIADERWARAMEAIEESERVVGSARYIRFFRRRGPEPDSGWDTISLNMATA